MNYICGMGTGTKASMLMPLTPSVYFSELKFCTFLKGEFLNIFIQSVLPLVPKLRLGKHGQ